MNNLIYILLAVYFAAVNIYAFMLVKSMKKKSEDRNDNTRPNTTKLFLCGVLGGAIAAYVSLFVLKFKTDNLLLMVFLPLLAAINIYLIVMLFRHGFFIITT